jgi:pyruvate dehydrogenase E1 component alpha subunit
MMQPGENGPSSEDLLEVYRKAASIFRNDEKVRGAIRAGKLAIIYYSPRGQEIIPAAMSAHLTASDYLVTIYRGIHDQIAKGIPLRELWAEYAGRVTGTCKGKGGPMHITHPETGIMVTTGVVGSGLPIANGLALGSQMSDDGRVTVVTFGDGATNIGAFHEALNLASVWKLPVIFLCQNNLYAEHTKFAHGTAVDNVADRAASYKMPGVIVNGNDPVAMWTVAREAVERARSGGGPTLIEAKTFRFNGHLVGDTAQYIPQEEMEEAVANDPVPLLRQCLIDKHGITEAQLAEMEQQIDAEVEDAINFALASDWPDASENECDVLTEAAHV